MAAVRWRRRAGVAVVVVAAAGGSAQASSTSATGEQPWTHVSTQPCPDSRFECTTLAVPRDHADPDGPQWEITFGLLPAAVESKGTFVTITGGPGTSGLALADSYTDFMAQEITDNFDIVFIDQRGVGASRPIRCDEAAAAYYLGDADPDDPAQARRRGGGRRAVRRQLHRRVRASRPRTCPTTPPPRRSRISRRSASTSAPSNSSSTARATARSTSRPTPPPIPTGCRCSSSTASSTSRSRYSPTTPRALAPTTTSSRPCSAACTADEVCAADAGGDALAVLRRPGRRRSKTAPIEYDFPMADGSAERRTFTANDLELAAAGTVNSLGDRMLLQRAVTAAADDNSCHWPGSPTARSAVDPETLEVVVDPSWSDATYYAVECLDYEFLPDAGAPRQRRRCVARAKAPATGIGELRLGSIFYGDLPCVYWPAQRTDVPRPAPITDASLPDAGAQRRHRWRRRRLPTRCASSDGWTTRRSCCSRAVRTSSSTGATRASTTSSATPSSTVSHRPSA